MMSSDLINMEINKREFLNLLCGGLLTSLVIHELWSIFLAYSGNTSEWLLIATYNLHGEGMLEMLSLIIITVLSVINIIWWISYKIGENNE